MIWYSDDWLEQLCVKPFPRFKVTENNCKSCKQWIQIIPRFALVSRYFKRVKMNFTLLTALLETVWNADCSVVEMLSKDIWLTELLVSALLIYHSTESACLKINFLKCWSSFCDRCLKSSSQFRLLRVFNRLKLGRHFDFPSDFRWRLSENENLRRLVVVDEHCSFSADQNLRNIQNSN